MGEGYTPPPSAGGGGGAVSTVAGRTGDVVLSVTDVSGAAPAASPTFTGTVTLPSGLVLPASVDISAALSVSGDGTPAIDGTAARGTSGHAARADHVHPTDTSRAPSSGIAASAITGTAVVTADSRLSDARTPTAHKTSHATGGSDALASGDLAPGVISGTAVVTADSRLSDARTPTAHKTSHATGGSDALVASDIGAAALASPTFTGTPLAPTPSVNDSTTKIATTAALVAQAAVTSGLYQVGPNSFASQSFGVATQSTAPANAGDGRWVRVMLTKSGTLHDVSFLSEGTAGNYNILVLDDGQANATHTTRTCLGLKGSTALPAAGTWMTYDPAISVSAGDTIVFLITFDATTGHCACSAGTTGLGSGPANWFPGSGASTTSAKHAGTALSANIPTTSSGAGSTITDANMPVAAALPLVCWRIT